MPVPTELRTERLLLRRWHPDDAAPLAPVLAANAAHLERWVPQRVIGAATVPELAERLAGFAARFDETREFRWGMFDAADRRVLGEVGLYPRDARSRVPLEQSDRIEVGYWLRADETGRGIATEAVRAALDVAHALPSLARFEIRCDAANAPSAAVPRRLGFRLEETVEAEGVKEGAPPVALQVWVLERAEWERARG